MQIKIRKLRSMSILLERKTSGSAGFDLPACIDCKMQIMPGETVLFPTGVALEIPYGHAGLIYTRSGLGINYGVHVVNGVGVIDSDYRGEIQVGLMNASKVPYMVEPMDRIAQLIVTPVALPELIEVDELDETSRGDGGFGSTGKS